MGKIVAIGGGEIGRPGSTPTTIPIEREVIRLSGKKNPQVLFIPTASSDSESYINIVKEHFGDRLHCEVDSLTLLQSPPSIAQIKRQIGAADIIYVGGGNTLKMMRRWRHLGVDIMLKKAYEKGTVLSGVSAGAICWFAQGDSDSMSFYSKKWSYIAVKGLGMIDALFCPHYASSTDGKPRSYHFKNMIAQRGGIGIGVTDNAALEVVDGRFRVLTSQPNEHVYLVYRQAGKVVEEVIPQTNTFKNLDDLLKRDI